MSERKNGLRPLLLRIDVLGGILICFFAVLIWTGSASLGMGELRNFGSGFLPRIFSVALLIGGLALLFRGFTQCDAEAEQLVLGSRGPLLIGLGILFFALTIRGASLGPIPIPQLGLLVAGPVTVLLAGLGSVEGEPRELVVLGIVLSALVSFLFVDLLNVQVPVLPAILADSLQSGWGFDLPRRVAIAVWLAAAYGLWRAFGLRLADLKERDRGTDR